MDSEQLECADKLRFATQKEAQAVATTIKHQRGIVLKTYECRQCEWWHLSSS